MKRILLSLIVTCGLCSSVFAADQWDKTKFADATLIPDAPGLMRVNNEAIDRILEYKKEGSDVIYSSSTQTLVSSGAVACSNSGGTVRRLRTNTSATTVTWANIDTGSEANSTTYYVYAVADTDATTFTIEISTNSTAPTGATYYKKLGSFYNDSSGNIDKDKIYTTPYGNAVNDSSGKNISKWLDIYDFGTSTSSYTERDESSMMVAYGRATMSGSSVSISNLPFTDTPSCFGIRYTAGSVSQAIQITSLSSSGVTFYDSLGSGHPVSWACIGE